MKNIDRWRANPVEFIEKVIVNPETGDLYVRASGCLRRYLSDIGLERRQRDVTPTLSHYLEEHDAKHEEEAA